LEPCAVTQITPVRVVEVLRLVHIQLSVGGPQMAKSKKKAETVFLVCEQTGDYNYTIRRKPGRDKLKVKKYCPRLRKHTLHNEKKK
jgi:large subunit ribosomal protein L33